MNRREIKLTLDCSLHGIEGNGDKLTFKVAGNRLNKAGNYEYYELTLGACRFSVVQIQRELRRMHIRDRARLVQEANRIEREVAELTKEQL